MSGVGVGVVEAEEEEEEEGGGEERRMRFWFWWRVRGGTRLLLLASDGSRARLTSRRARPMWLLGASESIDKQTDVESLNSETRILIQKLESKFRNSNLNSLT